MKTRRIPVGDGKFALVDEDDYKILSRFHWHFKTSSERIAVRTKWRIGKRQVQRNMSRVITGHVGVVKFKNGNRLDHRRANLSPRGVPLQNLMGDAKLQRLMNERDALDAEINNLILRSRR